MYVVLQWSHQMRPYLQNIGVGATVDGPVDMCLPVALARRAWSTDGPAQRPWSEGNVVAKALENGLAEPIDCPKNFEMWVRVRLARPMPAVNREQSTI